MKGLSLSGLAGVVVMLASLCLAGPFGFAQGRLAKAPVVTY